MKNLFLCDLLAAVVRRCLCLLMLCVVGLPCDTFADGDLFKVCFGSESAVQGELYCHNPRYGAVAVLQVLKNGVLARMHKMFSASQFVEERIIFVKMESSGVSDGEVLDSGLYRCTGTVSYETALGATKTVPAFIKLSSSEESKIDREREEAAKRWAAEEHARAVKEQPERKAIAQSIIHGVDLNMGCVRIEKEIAPSFEIRVKSFIWERLVESKAKGDWLSFLNAADDIVNNRSDFTARFDMIPDKETIRSVCEALKKNRFKCDFSCDKKLVFLVPNTNWRCLIASCKQGTVSVSQGIRRVFYRVADGSSEDFEPTGVLSYAKEEYGLAILGDGLIIVGEEGSVERYSRGDLKSRAEVLTKRIANQEISLSEFKSEMLAMDEDAWRKINEELITLPHGAELEQIRKADKDLKSEQQRKARQEFIEKVSTLSFCLGDYMIFQKGLLDYTHSVQVDEMWSSLSEFQKVGDWEAMARTVLGPGGSDLSDARQWVDARKKLLAHEFKFKINFTRNTGYYQRRKNGWNWRSFCDEDCLEISQKIDELNPVYVYVEKNGDPLFNKASNPGFDIVAWLKSTPVDMRDHRLGVEFTKKSWPGPRDVSPLLKHKDDELNAAKEDLSRFRRVVASVRWPPEYLVVTNVAVVNGKMKYTEKKKTFKIPQKVRGLALLLDNQDIVSLHGKYCGGLALGDFKEEWKQAGQRQEAVYKKYKMGFEAIEKEILKSIEKARPGSRSEYGQPLSLETIAARQGSCAKSVGQNRQKANETKEAKPMCGNCSGRGYVLVSEECHSCGGTGKTYTPAKKMITGYSNPRTSQCTLCSGKGTVTKRVRCIECSR